MNTSWDSSEEWYNRCVGEKGHYYHETIVLQGALRLLHLQPGDSLLDLGCGQGVLERSLPKTIQYTGIDNSKGLITNARKMSKAHFLIADVCQPLPLKDETFNACSFILSLQNMEFPDLAIQNAAKHLKKNGKLLLILNHPCFRIPRQSNWGVDDGMKLQYRRMNLYISAQKIPIQTNPSKGKDSPLTYSFHHPLSSFTSWISQSGLVITDMEEWCSDKQSTGGKAKMEDRARKEFPLFLAIVAQKK
jgi:SAM-dependent methyltransferase